MIWQCFVLICELTLGADGQMDVVNPKADCIVSPYTITADTYNDALGQMADRGQFWEWLWQEMGDLPSSRFTTDCEAAK